MFRPNQIGYLQSIVSRDVHGRVFYSEPRVCPFGVVSMKIASKKTTVRADSSASRGSADEFSAERARILIPARITVIFGDRFLFRGLIFKIETIHNRFSIDSQLDHFECDMESLPE